VFFIWLFFIIILVLNFLVVYSPQTPIFAIPKKRKNMLIIDSKDCENIDKALKKYKKKYEKSKTLLQLRERQAFIKPSIRRRGEILKAIYKQKIFNGTIES
jgi:small subunit ribosomal protein S21